MARAAALPEPGWKLLAAPPRRAILRGMSAPLPLAAPRFVPPLEPGFRPAVLADRAFRRDAERCGAAVPLVFALERPDGAITRYATTAFAADHPRAPGNVPYAERLLKFLLWARGGCRVHVGGPRPIGEALARIYAPGGARAFDADFLGRRVFERPFEIVPCAAAEVPADVAHDQPLGRHLRGCRIGFDLGASDVKVSAVIDGQPVWSEEIVWEPVEQPDPTYHYERIRGALLQARSHLPRLDAIGGSSAGVFVANQPRVASLFRGVPEARFGEVQNLFLRLREEFGVPLEVQNDGDVTALAGAMALEEDAVLGVAMGSSEAAGYINPQGAITGWLSELAFAPVDLAPDAPVDEWSGDRGVGASYFSQQCVFRLAPRVGIPLPAGATKAETLKHVQRHLEAGHEGAVRIWQTIGTCLGYALAHYAAFYELRHVLILGRVTSGRGGDLILAGAREVLAAEFPELAARLAVRLPDETIRRVGQSIAAASLPAAP